MTGSSDARGQATRATVAATVGTLVGYVASLIQWAAYARVLGVSGSTDALAAALAWLVGLTGLVGATFASATIPTYLRAAAGDPLAARDLFRTAQSAALALGLAIAVVTFVAAVPLASVLLPGSTASSRSELADILHVAAPLGFVWVAVHTLSALANARERYGAAAAATVIPSVPVIAALVLLPRPPVVTVAAAFLLGMTLEVVALALADRPWRDHLVPGLAADAIRGLGPVAAPVALSFVLLTLGSLVLRAIASYGAPGDVSVVDYALRIITAVDAVLLSGALAVVLTVWSADAARPGPQRLPVSATVRTALGFVVPAACALAVLAPAVVGVLFGGGRFAEGDVDRVSGFLVGIAAAFACHAMYLVIVRALLAQGRTNSFLASAALQLVVLAVTGLILRAGLGLTGLAAAYFLSWLAALIVGGASLPSLRDDSPALALEAARSLLAGLAPAGVAFLVLQVLPADRLIELVLGGASFAVAWLVVGRILGLTATRVALSELPGLVKRPPRGEVVGR